ncbi:MAG: hypothetical protein MJ113_00235 [Lachnospiraceae bacterium]|nr:hypothetical protein [Lachnospiraceae bacterium]
MAGNGLINKIESLLENGQSEKALELIKSVNLNKQHTYNELRTYSKVYKANGEYEKCALALEKMRKFGVNKHLLSELIEVYLELHDTEKAVMYYDTLSRSCDDEAFVLRRQYDVSLKRGTTLKSLIAILEELRKIDFDKKYGYELAKLYYKAQNTKACIEVCRQIERFFTPSPESCKALLLIDLINGMSKADVYKKARQFMFGDTYKDTEDEEDNLSSNNKNILSTKDEIYQDSTIDFGKVAEELETGGYDADFAEGRGESYEAELENTDRIYLDKIFGYKAKDSSETAEEGDAQAEDEYVFKVDTSVFDEVEDDETEEEQLSFIESEAESDVVVNSYEDALNYDNLENNVENYAAFEETDYTDKNDAAENTDAQNFAVISENDDVVRENSDKIAVKYATAETDTFLENDDASEASDITSEMSDYQEETSETKRVQISIFDLYPEDRPIDFEEFEEIINTVTESPEETAGPNDIYHPDYSEVLKLRPKNDSRLQKVLKDFCVDFEGVFGCFAYIENIRKQLIRCLDVAYSERGRSVCFAVTSDGEADRNDLAQRIMQFLFETGRLKTDRMLMVSAKDISEREPFEYEAAISDCGLILTGVGELSMNCLKHLIKNSKQKNGVSCIILVDSIRGLNKLLRLSDEFNSVFANRINIPSYTPENLKTVVLDYLDRCDYDVDNETAIALEPMIELISHKSNEEKYSLAEKLAEKLVYNADSRIGGDILEMASTGNFNKGHIAIIRKEDL